MRIFKFDTIKAIAMVCVVLVHAQTRCCVGPEVFRHAFVAGCLGASMYLFSFISGWMIKPGKWNWPAIGRLLVLVLVANILVNYVENKFYGKSNHNFVVWTFWYFYVLIACKIILPAFKRPWTAFALTLAISWLAFLLPSAIKIDPIPRFIGFAPFFALGYWVANDQRMARIRDFLTCDSYRMSACLGLFFATAVLVTVATTGYYPQLHLVQDNKRFIDCSVACGILRILGNLWFSLLALLWLKAIPSSECAVSKYGRRTLSVYLLHMIPIFIFGGFLKTHPALDAWYWRLLVMSLAVVVDLSLFSKPVNDVFAWVMSAGLSRSKG